MMTNSERIDKLEKHATQMDRQLVALMQLHVAVLAGNTPVTVSAPSTPADHLPPGVLEMLPDDTALFQNAPTGNPVDGPPINQVPNVPAKLLAVFGWVVGAKFRRKGLDEVLTVQGFQRRPQPSSASRSSRGIR